MAYTTIQEIKKRLQNISVSNEIIEDYILEAKEWIDGITKTSFEETASSSKIYTPRMRDRIIVIDYATEITKVEVLVNRTDSGDTWQEIQPVAYRVTPENTTPKSHIEFTGSIGYPIYFEGLNASIRVTAKWGYSVTTPPQIKRIANTYVVEQLRQAGYADVRVKSEKLGDASFTYDSASSDMIMDKLEKQLSQYKDWGDIRI